jgi:peptidoglycan/LPS O-acetylase OafA/YrhL
LLDLLKASGCLLIVLHHLAFYGPMSDVVKQQWPNLIDGLADHGRLAVQVFLVCSGYLTAVSFAREPSVPTGRLAKLAWKRYLRLSVPLLAALSMTVLLTELIRPGFNHSSLSAVPDLWQGTAHVLLLQDLLDKEALSAGVWYVAIDFQLYLTTILALWCVNCWVRWQPWRQADALRLQLMLALSALSLVRWNLNTDMDVYGLYFFGSYGMGWLAWRTRQSRIPLKGWAGLAALGLLAWLVDSRLRVMTAWAVTMLLATAPTYWMQSGLRMHPIQRAVGWLASISYSVFLIHFAVSLGVSAWVTRFWPDSLLLNAGGMVLSLALSVLAGAQLHRWTERHPQTWRHWLFWVAVFMASTGVAMHWNEASG